MIIDLKDHGLVDLEVVRDNEFLLPLWIIRVVNSFCPADGLHIAIERLLHAQLEEGVRFREVVSITQLASREV